MSGAPQVTNETTAAASIPPAVANGRRWNPGFASGLKGRIVNFTPSWFSVNMGTGISSIILHNLPYHFRGVQALARVLFVLNATLFIIFFLTSSIRYIVWPRIWTLMIHHNVQSLFLGTFAMGMATVGDGVVLFCVPAFGDRFLALGWAMWWINSVVSIVIGVGIPFLMFTRHKHEVASVTGMWLLPCVSPIVAASAGAVIAPLLSPAHARLTIIISYMMLGLSLPPAILIMALYFQRLAVHKVPPSTTIVSVFLPIGPCGQSAFTLLQLASALRQIQQSTGVGLGEIGSTASEQAIMVTAIYGVSLVAAIFLVGFGFFWLTIAVMTSLDLASKGGFPFNMGWWGFTFPTGTMASATILLAKELDSDAFKVVATVLSAAVLLFWLFVATRTCIEGFRGTVFVAPCLGPTGQPPVKTKSPKPTDPEI